MNELTAFFGRTFETVMTAAREQNVQLAGPPFALYHGMPTQTVDVEAGFPIAGDFHGTSDVVASALPETDAFEAMHQGSYDSLSTTYGAIQQRMEAEGLTPSDTMWEFYLSDPGTEPDPTKWLTRVVWPVA
ncbi:GyrI-like domain-containing protein [Arthrobacter silvisoli]|uniref:GyrI-like domain-containing protein n=1 Tax=Arthrobacter silvisoli TaxID=2291022 RepID=UPI001FE8CE6A|nr:GyrI-like domain-containing protein [Arthrobacter silvisoli]